MPLFSSSRRRDYAVLRIVVLVLLGGALNAMALKSLGEYYIYALSLPAIFPLLVAYSFLVFLAPLVMSFILTGIGREKQIIPPLYMQLVAFGLLTHYATIHPAATDLIALYVLFFYAIVAGLIQDRVVLSTLGRYTPRDQVVPFCLRVDADIDVIRDMLLRRRFRENLGLGKKVEEIEQGYRLKGRGLVKVVVQLERGAQQNQT